MYIWLTKQLKIFIYERDCLSWRGTALDYYKLLDLSYY